ncbi:Rid family hydrolase [Streptomyces zingiberis]|uniref:Rid family hydrolase n=1 Tax=Streptomyces zingiberis TaxID=2053010 RepID=UPI002892F87C|nr:Rid family hydrolase [Streptomyces zingiberis]
MSGPGRAAAAPPVQRLRSDRPWEETIGCARAVAAGDRVLVSGTMPAAGGQLAGEFDPYEQARAAFTDALAALAPFGLGPDSVIRTRMYLVHARDTEAVGRAHREIFGEVRPASTMLVVSGFAETGVLVEVEIEAYRGEDRTGPDPHPGPGPAATTG